MYNNDPRTHDLARTVAAIIDAHVRGETADVAMLACRDDDPRYLAQTAAAMAGLALTAASRSGDPVLVAAFSLQAMGAAGITDDELRQRKVRRMLVHGIGQGAGYLAMTSVQSGGPDAAQRWSRQLIAELAVSEP